MRAQVDSASVIKANAQFWEQMLSMSLTPCDECKENALPPGHFRGAVSLGGAWKGLIEVRLSPGLAYQATAAMMMQPVDTVAESDVLDASKEIANMIAGTIKSSLPRPCSMTVPEADVSDGNFHRPAEGEENLLVGFRHESGGFVVHIHEVECA